MLQASAALHQEEFGFYVVILRANIAYEFIQIIVSFILDNI
jgi:hypothetical protein